MDQLEAPLTTQARRFARARMERSKGALVDYIDQGTLVAVHEILGDLDGAGANRWLAAAVTATQRLLVGRIR